jgi:hypothetical protein
MRQYSSPELLKREQIPQSKYDTRDIALSAGTWAGSTPMNDPIGILCWDICGYAMLACRRKSILIAWRMGDGVSSGAGGKETANSSNRIM